MLNLSKKINNLLLTKWSAQCRPFIILGDNSLVPLILKEKSTLDSVGYGIGVKKIEDFNLIAITVRSGSYGAEWGSNFTVGTSGNSKGFFRFKPACLRRNKAYIGKKEAV